MLYVPGNDERKVKKVSTLDVDCAVMDCEDGVALNRKVGCFVLLLMYWLKKNVKRTLSGAIRLPTLERSGRVLPTFLVACIDA